MIKINSGAAMVVCHILVSHTACDGWFAWLSYCYLSRICRKRHNL